MSKFYGTVMGCRGVATRCGSNKSGIRATAQSYDGSIITSMYYDDCGTLNVMIETSERSSRVGDTIFHGTFEQFVQKLQA